MSRRHTIMLFALAAIWGASFMFIKVAVRELEPLALVWLRLTLAAIVLVPVALISLGRDALAEFRAAAGRLAVLGIANSALPFTLLSWAEIRLDSGVAAILQGAAPLFTALISVRYGTERVGGLRLVGVLVGFVGVALLVGAHSGNDLGAALAVVGMALCYSASGIFGSQRLRETSPLVVAAGSMVIGVARDPAVRVGDAAGAHDRGEGARLDPRPRHRRYRPRLHPLLRDPPRRGRRRGRSSSRTWCPARRSPTAPCSSASRCGRPRSSGSC